VTLIIGQLSEQVYLSRVPKKDIGRVYKALKPLLEDQTAAAINIEGYVSRFASQLTMPSILVRQAQELVTAEKKLLLLEGKSPTSIVAACLYAVSGLKRSLDENEAVAKARAESPNKPVHVNVPMPFTASEIARVSSCSKVSSRGHPDAYFLFLANQGLRMYRSHPQKLVQDNPREPRQALCGVQVAQGLQL
jgi:transcription initiation factor TFIIIB Brf1 subunit/transcription initiation factor TFIIB